MSEAEFDIVIKPGQVLEGYWRDLWRYRELFYFLAWRDVLIRYKQAFFGFAWAVLRPAVLVLIFTFVFNRVANLSSEGAHYPLFVLAALLPWQLFSTSLADSGQSIIEDASLVSKVYFPRIIIPASSIMADVMDFIVGILIFFVLQICLGAWPGISLVTLPFFAILLLALCLGVGLLFSALNVKYRDFRYVVPFVLQVGLYASPVGYGSHNVPEKWQMIYLLNPMVGIIDGFRFSLCGVKAPLLLWSVSTSIAITTFLLGSGFYYFRRTERFFADIV